MATDVLQDSIGAAGDIVVEEVVLINAQGEEINIKLYVGEINLHEDMFSNGMYGNIFVIDNYNLPEKFGIIGDEYLRLKLYTPSMPNSQIYKMFKVYSITDKIFTNDTARQSYILHFCSPEIFVDAYSPIYKTFSGSVDEIAENIYSKYLAIPRVGDQNYTPLVILGQTSNIIKFNSPGWRPMKCLNWLAAKASSTGFKNPGYLFYESNKAFYFANYEEIIFGYNSGNLAAQTYIYSASETTAGNLAYINDIDRQYKTVMDFKVTQSFDNLKNSMNGYLANRLYTMDMVTKKYEIYDYDHTENYNAYHHMEDVRISKGTSKAPFSRNSTVLNSPAGYNQIAMKHFGLHTGFRNNANDIIQDIKPRRTSTLNELQNLKIEISVPGRTDTEIGSVVNFIYPDASPRDNSDINSDFNDKLFTGKYLITAIRHKINLQRHIMTMELVKDSYAQVYK